MAVELATQYLHRVVAALARRERLQAVAQPVAARVGVGVGRPQRVARVVERVKDERAACASKKGMRACTRSMVRVARGCGELSFFRRRTLFLIKK